MRGTKEHLIPCHLAEYWWKGLHENTPFWDIIAEISSQFPLVISTWICWISLFLTIYQKIKKIQKSWHFRGISWYKWLIRQNEYQIRDPRPRKHMGANFFWKKVSCENFWKKVSTYPSSTSTDSYRFLYTVIEWYVL